MKAAGALLIVTVWIILLPRIYDLSPSCASLHLDLSSQCSYTLADPTCFGTVDSVASTCKLTGSCIGTFIGWTRGFLMVVMNALLPLPAQHGTEQYDMLSFDWMSFMNLLCGAVGIGMFGSDGRYVKSWFDHRVVPLSAC